ncbi:MAG: pirin family protein [Methylobacterium mesophilicum]|nr:pirin family protein [Methylobacterium mesophilicum]
MLLKGERTPVVRDMGGFVAQLNMPGWLFPRPTDHGHGGLAMVVESRLVPGRRILMHEHRNDEIISWVPEGVMRHEDRHGCPLVVDGGHLMVMNAGQSFWHSEETLPTDPPLRMLQIMVRPRSPDLPPRIQHAPLHSSRPNRWRHLVGPEGGEAPFFVRSAIDFHDLRLERGATATSPQKAGCDLYFLVFSGSVAAGHRLFAEGEQGLLVGGGALSFEAAQDSVVAAFVIDPSAEHARRGTVGDHPGIPRPAFARPVMGLLRLRKRWRERFRW